MKVTPLAADSLGARSMATLVETRDVTVLIDPSVRLGPYRYDLRPHPTEKARQKELWQRIRTAAKTANVLTVSHYHYDHHNPDAPSIYRGKILVEELQHLATDKLRAGIGFAQHHSDRASGFCFQSDHGTGLLLTRRSRPLNRHTVTRMTSKAGTAAGLPHIHPRQLRHTLATQAINRGMSLEAIAAMLGHRSLDMTLRYAKIASRTVADEYFAVTEKAGALYGQPAQLPADAIGPKMARLRREHHRLLGNGWCTRPPQLDCAFESICETCSFQSE